MFNMPLYDESKRCKAFGDYTGCPCCVGLPITHSVTDYLIYNEQQDKFFKDVNELIKKWESSCDKYIAGPTVGSRIHENWNRDVKLPYGIFANIRCAFDEGSPIGHNYCKHSLKNESTVKSEKVYSKINGYVKIANNILSLYSSDSNAIEISHTLPDNAILNVEDGDFVAESDLLFIY